MNIKRSHWIICSVFAAISVAVWFRFSYPQLAFLNFSVDRDEALNIAKDFLLGRGEDVSLYKPVAIFNIDTKANRYLQRTLGFDGLLQFSRQHDYDMFYWVVRYFREKEKEEYRVEISSATGEVIGYKHTLDDSEVRKKTEREDAKSFLIREIDSLFGFNPELYFLKGDLLNIKDYRSDYDFSWQKNSVAIPWSNEPNSGIGKLLTGGTVSGEEVTAFSKNTFSVPEQFERHLNELANIGNNITMIVQVFYMILFVASISILVSRKDHLVLHSTKKFYFYLVGFSFLLSILALFNTYQNILYAYETTAHLEEYVFQYLFRSATGALFIAIAVFMPALSGELLRYEERKPAKEGGLLHYILSSFATPQVSRSIFMGYLFALIMLGIQSILIKVGQTYWGVWVEHGWMTHFTTAYLPFLAAFTLAYKAALSEETLFRLFAINWGKKILKNMPLVIVLSSAIWGFAHSAYPVFPMWFRGIEVTCLGILLGYGYIRFGIITVFLAHYLFDAFWGTAGYLFGTTQDFYWFSSFAILVFPLLFGLFAYFRGRPVPERPMRWNLNKNQEYNVGILTSFLRQNHSQFAGLPSEDIRKDIVSKGWDPAVVEIAIEQFQQNDATP